MACKNSEGEHCWSPQSEMNKTEYSTRRALHRVALPLSGYRKSTTTQIQLFQIYADNTFLFRFSPASHNLTSPTRCHRFPMANSIHYPKTSNKNQTRAGRNGFRKANSTNSTSTSSCPRKHDTAGIQDKKIKTTR